MSPEQELVPRAGPAVLQMRVPSSTCPRSWGLPDHLQLAVLVADSSQTPNPASPANPRFTESCLAANFVHCGSGGIASVALPVPAHWLCPAGAAAGTEHGEAAVQRDAALFPVHHQAGDCECLGGALVGQGSEPRGTTTPGQRPRKGYQGTPEGPWLCELIAGVFWIQDFASNRTFCMLPLSSWGGRAAT